MTRDKDLKRRVRARMKKTGEAYTTARTRVLEKSDRRKPVQPVVAAPPTPEPPPPPTPAASPSPAVSTDLASLAGMADATIAAKTGRSWSAWVAVLDADGAHAMEHRDIARLVNEQYDVDGWWSQMVTVGYERIRGLRERGQRRGGSYEANKSKTFPVPVTTLFDACVDETMRGRWLKGAKHQVTTATRPRSIRLRWDDGTLVALWFEEKGDAKSVVGVQHTKLPDRVTAERLKQYWAERLAALAELLPVT